MYAVYWQKFFISGSLRNVIEKLVSTSLTSFETCNFDQMNVFRRRFADAVENWYVRYNMTLEASVKTSVRAKVEMFYCIPSVDSLQHSLQRRNESHHSQFAETALIENMNQLGYSMTSEATIQNYTCDVVEKVGNLFILKASDIHREGLPPSISNVSEEYRKMIDGRELDGPGPIYPDISSVFTQVTTGFYICNKKTVVWWERMGMANLRGIVQFKAALKEKSNTMNILFQLRHGFISAKQFELGKWKEALIPMENVDNWGLSENRRTRTQYKLEKKYYMCNFHTGGKEGRCTYVGTYSSVNEHFSIHTGVYLYHCWACESYFSERCDSMKDLKKSHVTYG
ncbi:hypothetical protein GCK72_026177 [Caenorhabditis remanei]|uniref:C2H2-type domain-containing protein n=1 Tax=Caenorhabditis remanei TaxID=31234 RepID=A0A6A5G5D5_CAERE|nr:hypothetical protein GCK72_026177 [Caenorhabditis remanei]KAF1749709.1 hypothetical protein GCK72_026177 [Caenorhabditis remanei]